MSRDLLIIDEDLAWFQTPEAPHIAQKFFAASQQPCQRALKAQRSNSMPLLRSFHQSSYILSFSRVT